VEGIAIDLFSCGCECGNTGGRVERKESTGGAGWSKVDILSLKLGFECSAVRLGGDHDRRLPGTYGSGEIGRNHPDELSLVLVEVNDVLIALNCDVLSFNCHSDVSLS
jgi:hypothetical protein